MTFRQGDWIVYCDICGKKCYASDTTKLSTYTGRGGLIVCRQDIDNIDIGLIPYKTTAEKNISFTRINHTDTSNGSPLLDLEEMALCYFLSASQDNIILTASQDVDDWLVVCEPI